MDLAGMKWYFESCMHHENPELRHFIMPLISCFKSETGEKSHLMPLAPETASGVKAAVWVKQILAWYYDRNGIMTGPVFRDEDGKLVWAMDYDFEICVRIEEVQQTMPGIVDPDIDVHARYCMRCSLR